MPRKNPVPTPAQQRASRENGRLGGRPRNEWGMNESRRRAAEARRLGFDQRLVNLRFWISVRDSGEAPLEQRMRAAEQIEKRYGQPEQSVTISAPMDLEDVKTIEFVGYPPPAGWNGDDDLTRRPESPSTRVEEALARAPIPETNGDREGGPQPDDDGGYGAHGNGDGRP